MILLASVARKSSMILCIVSQLQFLLRQMVMYSGCLFRCMVFCNTMMERNVEPNMEVSQEWQLWFLSYERFMGMLWACTMSGNDDALLLLGLVKTLFFSLLNTTIYLMPIFGRRMSLMNWVQEQRGSNTYYRQRTMDTMKQRTSLGSSRLSTTTHQWKSRKPCYTSTSLACRPYLTGRSESGSVQCIGRLSSRLKGMRRLVAGIGS
jgi:hypothetical protein